jgi:hypothetical protein
MASGEERLHIEKMDINRETILDPGTAIMA